MTDAELEELLKRASQADEKITFEGRWWYLDRYVDQVIHFVEDFEITASTEQRTPSRHIYHFFKEWAKQKYGPRTFENRKSPIFTEFTRIFHKFFTWYNGEGMKYYYAVSPKIVVDKELDKKILANIKRSTALRKKQNEKKDKKTGSKISRITEEI